MTREFNHISLKVGARYTVEGEPPSGVEEELKERMVPLIDWLRQRLDGHVKFIRSLSGDVRTEPVRMRRLFWKVYWIE